ncbi:MAG: hypothetical protein ABFR90_12215 [Planctomycetota bacterium]
MLQTRQAPSVPKIRLITKHIHNVRMEKHRGFFFRWPVILLVLLGLVLTGCEKEKPDHVIPSPPEESVSQKEAAKQQPASKLYEADRCLTLSEILYEWYLYSYQSKEEAKPIVQQSAQACGKILADESDNLEAKINLISSRYLLPKYYNRERIDTGKVEETVRRGVDEGLEEARLLMGMMVTGRYFKDSSNEFEILLPLLKSYNPRMLAVVGVDMQIESTSRYSSINPVIAYKHLPLKLFEDVKYLNGLIAKNYALSARARRQFNYKIAALAFTRAYTINKDILSGYELGVSFMDGLGVKQDTAKALEYLHDVVERGSPKGHFELGLIYSKLTNIGNELEGFEKDQEKSIYMFEQALLHNDDVSRFALSRIYLDEKFGYYNEARGIKLYCQISVSERPEKTVYSREPIRVNCDSVKQEK